MTILRELENETKVIELTLENSAEFSSFCPEPQSELYRRLLGTETFIGLGIKRGSQALGLTFGLKDHADTFWLKALELAPCCPDQYAQELLTTLAAVLRERGQRRILAFFTRYEKAPRLWLESQLTTFGFNEPEVYKKVYKLPYWGLEKTGLLRLELPEWAEIVNYSALPQDCWDELRSGAIPFPEDLSPFMRNPDIGTSIFLLREGDVIGWNITRRLNADAVYFQTLFVTEEYRASPLGIQLLAKALHLYLDNPENMYGVFGARPDNKELYRFIQKRFGRHCSDIAVDYQSIYNL